MMKHPIAAVLFCLGASWAEAQDLKPLYVDPACPKPAEVVTLRAASADASWQLLGPGVLSVDGSTLRFVVPRSGRFPGEPARYVNTTAGPLPIGTYRAEVDTRDALSETELGPERLDSVADFVVQEKPPACEARSLLASSSGMLNGTIGRPYDPPNRWMSVWVTDAHGLSVPNARIEWERIAPVGETETDPQRRPGLANVPETLTTFTNSTGHSTLTPTANSVPGTFQYRAYLRYADRQSSAWFILRNQLSITFYTLIPVVEYYHAGLHHYFLTANRVEMYKLDFTERTGWRRTGGVFIAYAAAPEGRPEDSHPVCRFYGRPQAGLDSHFFSASAEECAAVAQRFGDAWLLETPAAFAIALPDTQTGRCPPRTRPVHRLYNNRRDANHRYGIAPVERLQPGDLAPWLPEGYGLDAVVMCAVE